ncbi:MAG: serine/threonine-protein phosphatase [Oscillospiraceae bacterium]|nr:serine/threonine-protein phosphatase [Oscillospiraceae bacterium]
MNFIHGCYSDIGNTRPNNEDSILSYAFEKDGLSVCVGIICDGIGGLANGEFASRKMTAYFMNWIVSLSTTDLSQRDFQSITMEFKEQLHTINGIICKEAALNSIQTGTTVSGVIIVNDDFMTVNVGDSRVYKVVKKSVTQLTSDDVQMQNRNGIERSVLSQCIGYDGNIFISTVIGKVEHNDAFIFCSDGFYKLMKDKEIAKTLFWLNKKKNVSLVCSSLIEKIKSRGERDNISLGIIKCINK